MYFQNLAFILPSFQKLLLKEMLVVLHNMVFIGKKAALLCVTMREHGKAFASAI